ncbi:RING-type domain-containing protein [Meloidogyne graminicola]|uniref:RING-type domain-containing protein n=1 Tax=Meloidogyne graminicola TaxID=189291 RepID=A0A8S9ZTK9_9BILA|nr:RING-type domain-containing protein [Meloidogyne graminicola]
MTEDIYVPRQCPKCKTSEFQNRSLVMMLNECCHPICQNCMENLFARNVGQCPYKDCDRTLKKSGFWIQEFDDLRVERENFIRKRILKTYNLQEDDFDNLRDYNDYLERVEDIIFKLANDIDTDAVEAEVKTFREENAELIERNKRRPTKDDLWIRRMLDEDELRKQKLENEHKNDLNQIKSLFNPRDVIEELRSSDLPAEVVLDRQRKKQIEHDMAEKEKAERIKRIKQEEKQRSSDRVVYGVVRHAGKPYFHATPILSINGPPMISEYELIENNFLKHIREPSVQSFAGGFHAKLGCMRALYEARADLFLF